MIVNVRMEAFANGIIRHVDIPDNEWNSYFSELPRLESVFYYGQNDFQSQDDIPSVSVGDVILLNGQEYRVESLGFSKRVTGGYASGRIHCEQGIIWREL